MQGRGEAGVDQSLASSQAGRPCECQRHGRLGHMPAGPCRSEGQGGQGVQGRSGGRTREAQRSTRQEKTVEGMHVEPKLQQHMLGRRLCAVPDFKSSTQLVSSTYQHVRSITLHGTLTCCSSTTSTSRGLGPMAATVLSVLNGMVCVMVEGGGETHPLTCCALHP
jgi:hypothetical protein